MNKRLIIIGASGHGKVVADIAMKMNKWEEIFFLDDSLEKTPYLSIPIKGTSKDIKKYRKNTDFFIAIGNNNIRESITIELEKINISIATLIHPTSIIGKGVELDQGTVVMARAVINPSVSVGKGTIINTGSIIEHDCIIGDFVHVSPGVNIAGTVRIGERTWLGIGSTVINNIVICNDVIVGAASLVLKDIQLPGVYVGNLLRRIDNESFSSS